MQQIPSSEINSVQKFSKFNGIKELIYVFRIATHFSLYWLVEGRAVSQLVEALRYKPERRGFDSDGVTGIFP
jgi:hypothetical protein